MGCCEKQSYKKERLSKSSKIIVDEKMLSEKISCAKDGDSIELTIVPAQNDGGVRSPAFLHIALLHIGGIYEDLESIDESKTYVQLLT